MINETITKFNLWSIVGFIIGFITGYLAKKIKSIEKNEKNNC